MYRRLLALDPSHSDYYGLGLACEDLSATHPVVSERHRAQQLASHAFRLAAEKAIEQLDAAEPDVSHGDSGAQAAPDEADRLSERCPHISRADVEYLLPQVAPMLSPSGGADSWRSLFNLAPSVRRGRRHRGKVFGLGLSKTGSTSLRTALDRLGWSRASAMDLEFVPRAVHRLRANATATPASDAPSDALAPLRDFLDETDAATDLPTALFAPELLAAYPDALFVLTTRPPLEWWRSASRQMSTPFGFDTPIGANRALAYGDVEPREYLWTKRYVAHAVETMRAIPCERLLLMDIVGWRGRSEGWDKLAGFLGVPKPKGVRFPRAKPAPTVADAPPTSQSAR